MVFAFLRDKHICAARTRLDTALAKPEKTAAQKLVDDWRRGPGRSVAETYQASFHPGEFGKTHRHTLRAMAAQGRANGFGGVTIVPVPAGTEIRKDGQVEVVTATQAVHDENVVYVTPAHYEKLKAETEGPSDARR